MFMKFTLCDHNGSPLLQRVLINLRSVQDISELGSWNMPVPEVRVGEWSYSTNDQIFTPIPNCVCIRTKDNAFNVIGNFDELAATFQSLNEIFERT